MKLQASSKQGGNFGKKPHIKKGYYPAQLLEVKPRQKMDGTPVEGQYGRQIVMTFLIHDENKKPMSVTKDNLESPLIIPLVLNSEYKQPDGSYRTAVTPNSYITKVCKALGWEFNAEDGVDLDKLVGNFVELNLDDYDAEITEQDDKGKDVTTKYKASSIKDVSPLESGEKSSSSKPIPETTLEAKENLQEADAKNKELDDKIERLKKQLDEGYLTQKGYDMAVQELEKMKR